MFLPLSFIVAALISSCEHYDVPSNPNESAANFTEISSTDIGETGAAEISAYDPITKKLFTVTNSGAATQIDIHDLSNPSALIRIGSIDITPYGGGVNSVAVSNGKLAAAVEGMLKTDPGKIILFKTSDYSVIKQVSVGALPDMVTFTHDGKYVLSANEGEPADDYSVDPAGTVSIISVNEGYAATTLDFSGFVSQQTSLKAKGLRIFGPNDFVKNIEPEYITVSADSRTAWVTLQENNAIAKLDIKTKKITHIFPLGFKDYSVAVNPIDPSDRDNGISFRNVNVKGMYLPDGIAVFDNGTGTPFLFTANEGDVREWLAFAENKRVKDLTLDPVAFPNAAILKQDANLGRLNVTSTLGDIDGDNDFDILYSFGARSFSVWNGNNGKLVYDCGNELETQNLSAGYYDDGRSDDKGVEPEAVVLGVMGRKAVAFVGMERSDAIAIYDVTNPSKPSFIKLLHTGDAPEGLLFIPASDSPTNKSLLVVSSEGDGTIKVYQAE